jgi:beta-adrenergic-receptor kinase
MESRRNDIIRSYPGMRVKKHNLVQQHSFNYPSLPLSSSPESTGSMHCGDAVHQADGANTNSQNPIHSQLSGSNHSSNDFRGFESSSSIASASTVVSGIGQEVAVTGSAGDEAGNGTTPAPGQISKRVSNNQMRLSRRSSQANKSSLVAFGGMDDTEGDLDLPLPVNNISTSVSNPSLSMDVLATKLAEDWKEYIVGVEHPAPNAVRLKGEPLIKIKNFFGSLLPSLIASSATSDSINRLNNSDNGGNSNGVSIGRPTNSSFVNQLVSIFDEIENIIFYCLVDRHWLSFRSSSYWTRYWQFMSMLDTKVVETDFALFRVLGRGGFGMVSGCKHCYSGKLFALKTMNKKRVKMKKAEALCLNERNILAVVDSPYIACLKYAFDTPTELTLVLDLMIGGDLGFHLSARKNGGFTVPEAKYYSARILMGIAALHDLNIVYRDLKPENVLMDENGATKLSDLGLACKVGRNGLSGTCGTRGYWAPEMLRKDKESGKRERYGLSVDWFSFGCCLYEFIRGVGPFRTERARQWGDFPKVEKVDKDRAIDLAIQEMEPEFTPAFDDCLRDLITKLLNKNGKTRLGAKGYDEIRAHSWFAEIDFENLNNVTPPIKPNKDINMASQSDIGSFTDERESRKVVLTEADQKVFEKWQFISQRSFQEEVVGYLLYEELNVSL